MTTLLRLSLWAMVAAVATGCSDAATPTSATSTTEPITAFTFSSTFTARGSASRSFTSIAPGEIALTLTAASPDVRLGIGVGIPRPDGSGCNLTQAAEVGAGSGPHITIAADPGTWCVRVYDLGSVSERVAFSLDVTHF